MRARHRGKVMRLAGSARTAAQRFSYLAFVALAAGLMILGKAEAPVIERLRTTVTDVLVPVYDLLSRPFLALSSIGERMRSVGELFAENQRLREENERLLQWQVVARRLEAENKSLRDLARFAPEDPVSYVTARIVADAGGSFVRSVLVTAGSQHGVAKGQTAIAGDGLVGRVGEVGERAARVLLLTDLNSQVPVVMEGSRERAILAGDNSDMPRLLFIAADVKPEIGDRVVTSGHGGVFPPGIPVGLVATLGSPTSPGIRVKPFVEFHRLEHVRLIDYGVAGTLPMAAPGPRRVQR